MQAHWLLSEPSDDAVRIVAARKKIQELTASDAVHDAPRIMRLPGTHNSKCGDGLEAKIVSKIVSHPPAPRSSPAAFPGWIARPRALIPRQQGERPQSEQLRTT